MSKTSKPNSQVHAQDAFSQLVTSYTSTTPASLLIIDALLAFLLVSGVLQFSYCCLITNFPFNAFLGSFSAHVGQFVLAASLRSQVNPLNHGEFTKITPERAFADFVFGSLILHFFALNFLG